MLDMNLALELKEKYKIAKPFPHIVIDNFLPLDVLNRVLEDVESIGYWGFDNVIEHKYQLNKKFIPWDNDSALYLRKQFPFANFLLDFLNCEKTLKFLRELTGIQDLVSDEQIWGGGYHKISNGGKLEVHADYNVHPFTKKHRRINLLLYLNKNWQKDWNGNLELWEKDGSAKAIDIAPIFNRVVIFNTTSDALHGHPIPLNCPENVSRYSAALYYFTNDRPEEEKNPEHPVLWKQTT